MNYIIDYTSKVPAYMQLYQHLRQDIISGVYPLGSRIPSKRIIATETGLSVIPVEHALQMLCDEGYLEAKQRSGMFVIYRNSDFQGKPAEIADMAAFETKTAEQYHTGDFPYSVLAKTMRKVITDYQERILTKSPNSGCEELRSAICAYIGRSRGIFIEPRQVIIGSGAEYLYGLIVQLLGKERIYALENPSYDKIRKVYETYGVRCELLSMGQDGIYTRELDASEASVLHVTPFNSYPSGISASVSKKQEYLHWARMRQGYIIEDNYESELTVSRKMEDTVFSMSTDDNVIYMNTFSKTIAPSMRIGYMILPVQLLVRFETLLGFYSCTVPVFEQYVLAELLNSGDFERHINRMRRNRRKLLEQQR